MPDGREGSTAAIFPRAFQRVPKVTLGWRFGREKANQPNLEVPFSPSAGTTSARGVHGVAAGRGRGAANPGHEAAHPGHASPRRAGRRPVGPRKLRGVHPLRGELAHCGQ